MRAFPVYGWIRTVLLILLCFCYANSYLVNGEYSTSSRGGNSMTFKYDRINEVTKECSSVLSSASDLKTGDNIVLSLKEELSFLNGDWWEELTNKAPLIPFMRDLANSSSSITGSPDSSDSNSSMDLGSPSSIVSFWVTDVSSAYKSHNWIAVSGSMLIGKTIQGLLMERPYEGSHFDIWPGHSQLIIMFQGIYSESNKNGGERVMCLLGNTRLPSRGSDSANPWDWVKESGYTNQPPLAKDDQILLVLRYPRRFGWLHRSIQGSMKSLNRKSDPKYFDEVGMSSWLAATANYEFVTERSESTTCEPYPDKDSLMTGEFNVYKGLDFCPILERFTHQEVFSFVPNWKCNGTDEFCSKLGPFTSDKEIKAADGSFQDFKLVIQDFRCAEEASTNEDGFRRISLVFRAFSSSEDKFFASQRTGLTNMTLSAEGTWTSSCGQLSMVGCLGGLDGEGSECHSQIILYIPLSFSIKQRSIITGTFSSVNKSTRPYFPLTFEKLARPGELWDQYTAARPYYKYSKIKAAGISMQKNEPFNFGNMVKKSLLKFPRLDEAESYLVSLSLLSEDLTIHMPAVPDSSPKSFLSRTDFQLEILSLGPLFGRYWSPNVSADEELKPFHNKAEYSEKQLLLNVSAQIGLMGKPYNNFSVLFVEGLYNPLVGKMYLVGCRDVRASWKIIRESVDLEAGLDCLIEVILSYHPTTSRWLVNPTARISISSQRNVDDPLYFRPIKLQTLPIVYRKQREDILSRRGVEELLRILTLSLAIACLLSQIYYIKNNLESVPCNAPSQPLSQ